MYKLNREHLADSLDRKIKPTAISEIPAGIDYVIYMSLLTEMLFPVPNRTLQSNTFERNFPYPSS